MEKVSSSKSKWNNLKKFLKGHLNTEISIEPSDVHQKLVSKKIYKKVDENKIVSVSDAQSSPQGLIIIPLVIFLFLYFLGPDDMFSSSAGLYISISLISLVILGIIYYFTIPDKDIILNRNEGKITVPGFMWKKGFSMDFDRARFGWVGTGGASGNLDMILAVKHPDYVLKGSKLYGHITKFDKLLSFFVWYMDKNRPLPPGDAFDEFRQQDFERRKAAGFPRPLYPGIATPEATKEQQKEREAIGGW